MSTAASRAPIPSILFFLGILLLHAAEGIIPMTRENHEHGRQAEDSVSVSTQESIETLSTASDEIDELSRQMDELMEEQYREVENDLQRQIDAQMEEMSRQIDAEIDKAISDQIEQQMQREMDRAAEARRSEIERELDEQLEREIQRQRLEESEKGLGRYMVSDLDRTIQDVIDGYKASGGGRKEL